MINDILIGANYVDRFRAIANTEGTFLGFPVDLFSVGFVQFSGSPSDRLTSTALPTDQATFDAFPDDWSRAELQLLPSPGTPVVSVGQLTTFSLTIDADHVLACDGFYEPFDSAVSLSRKSRSVIPLRISLLDQDGVEIGPDTTAPVVSVSRTGSIGGGELDELVDAAGRAT